MTTWRIDLWHASVGCQLVTNGFIKKDQFLEVSRFWNQQFFWVHVSSRYFQLVAIAMKFCQVYHMFIMHATEIQQMVFLRDMLHFDDSSWCVWLFLGAFLLFTTSFKSLEKKSTHGTSLLVQQLSFKPLKRHRRNAGFIFDIKLTDSCRCQRPANQFMFSLIPKWISKNIRLTGCVSGNFGTENPPKTQGTTSSSELPRWEDNGNWLCHGLFQGEKHRRFQWRNREYMCWWVKRHPA